MNYLAICLSFLLTFQMSGWADTNSVASIEEAFYAISSLRFYVDELLDSHQREEAEEPIIFNPEEVEALWEKSLTGISDTLASPIEQAWQNYEEIIDQPQLDVERIKHTQTLLTKAWQELEKEMGLFEAEEETETNHKPKIQFLAQQGIYPNFDDNPHLDPFAQLMRRHLIPLCHPMKVPLDRIFCHCRAIHSCQTLCDAGFRILFNQPISFIKVVCHPWLPGYLLKLYVDSDCCLKDNKPGWWWLSRRCEGAANIRKLIKRKKLKCFVVPEKWLYPLPVCPPPLDPCHRQLFVLLVEDMCLVSYEESNWAWKNVVTRRHLRELYQIISHGYASIFLPGNIPYSRKGVFACIDTEYPKRKPNYRGVKRYLSPQMQKCWDKIVRSGGK